MGRPVTSAHIGAGEPVEVYDAGSSGACGLLLRARGSVSWQRTLRATLGRDGRGRGSEGVWLRWKWCSSGSPGSMSGRRRWFASGPGCWSGSATRGDAGVQDHDGVAAIDAGLAGGVRGGGLEDVMEVWLLNAAHMKAVPGRKSAGRRVDRAAARARAAPSFVPPPEIRRLDADPVSGPVDGGPRRLARLLRARSLSLSEGLRDLWSGWATCRSGTRCGRCDEAVVGAEVGARGRRSEVANPSWRNDTGAPSGART